MQKIETGPLFTKVNLKWFRDLIVRLKTIKFLKKAYGGKVPYL
jgi:hypothetical protein